MTEAIERATLALMKGRRMSLTEAEGIVPSVPGLYAFFADEAGLRALDLKTGGPVYVGKAEKSLLGRDVRTHFATGKTGSSTLRRTLAALLRDELQLRAIPRNLSRRTVAPTLRWRPRATRGFQPGWSSMSRWRCGRPTPASTWIRLKRQFWRRSDRL